jgi:hypothetical protein
VILRQLLLAHHITSHHQEGQELGVGIIHHPRILTGGVSLSRLAENGGYLVVVIHLHDIIETTDELAGAPIVSLSLVEYLVLVHQSRPNAVHVRLIQAENAEHLP